MMPALPEIHVGSPMWCEALALHPLYSECPSTLNYLLSYEAMGAGTLVVREVSRDGSVPDLVVENNGSSSVLFLEGTELQGAKQDRMLFQSVLVGANSRIHVPVVCIEHGRWHGISRYFTPGDSMCPPSMRRHLKGDGRRPNQHDVWNAIRLTHLALGVYSDTEKMSAAITKHWRKIAEIDDQLAYPASACGVAVALDGKTVAIDMFDKPATLERLRHRLVQGLALDVLGNRSQAGATDGADVLSQLRCLRYLNWQPVRSWGLGENYVADGFGMLANALFMNETAIHISVAMAV